MILLQALIANLDPTRRFFLFVNTFVRLSRKQV